MPSTPPEATSARGSSYTLQAVNGRLTVLDAKGHLVLAGTGGRHDLTLAALFAPVLSGDGLAWYSPRCLYDESSQRFILAALAADFTAQDQAWMVIAVSAGADPHSGTWSLFAFRTDQDAGSTLAQWGDYLQLGLGGSLFVAAFNEQQFSSNAFAESRVWVFALSDLLSGGPASYSEFRGLIDQNGDPSSSLVPCRHRGANAAFYLVNSKAAQGTSVELWRLTGPADNATLASTTILLEDPNQNLLPYFQPPTARQPGVNAAGLPGSIDTGDCRVRAAVADGNQVWVTLNSAAHWTSDVELEGTIHWTQVDAVHDHVVQSIAFGGPGYDYYDAAIDTTTGKHPGVVFVFNRSGPREAISLRTTYRDDRFPPMVLKTSKPLITGAGKFDPDAPRDPFDPGGPVAWGPCSSATRDPAHPNQVLVGGQFSSALKAHDTHAWDTQMGLVKLQ